MRGEDDVAASGAIGFTICLIILIALFKITAAIVVVIVCFLLLGFAAQVMRSRH